MRHRYTYRVNILGNALDLGLDPLCQLALSTDLQSSVILLWEAYKDTLESIRLYEKRIKSYYKYYTFRELPILKEKNNTSESVGKFTLGYVQPHQQKLISSSLTHIKPL